MIISSENPYPKKKNCLKEMSIKWMAEIDHN